MELLLIKSIQCSYLNYYLTQAQSLFVRVRREEEESPVIPLRPHSTSSTRLVTMAEMRQPTVASYFSRHFSLSLIFMQPRGETLWWSSGI